MILSLIHIIIILGVPYLSQKFSAYAKSSILSPVVLCYATGIILRNLTSFPVDEILANSLLEASIILAIPLLLFSADLMQTIRYAGKSLLSYIICVVSGILCVGFSAFLYTSKIPLVWIISGMVVGIFTGGTPNANAIAIALEAEDAVILVNGADTLVGGLFLIFLTSAAPLLYAKVLPKFDKSKLSEGMTVMEKDQIIFKDLLKGIALAIMVVGLSAGITYLVYGSLGKESNTFLILMLTSLSIIASLSKTIRSWKGTFLAGEYLLLVFCVVVGMLANMVEIINTGLDILGFYCLAFFMTVVLHIFISRLFKIDRDTVLISSTAAFYGPVFIGQIATTINNRSLIFTGMALSIFGLAIGNYVGIGVYYLILNWLG